MEIDIHNAMLNSYRVIIQGQLPEDIISTELGMFAHDPTEPVEKEVIENMLFYFEYNNWLSIYIFTKFNLNKLFFLIN